MSVEHACQEWILGLGCHDCHVFEILCCRTDQRDAAYVYFFNYISFGCAACNCLLERIEVYDHEVYLGNLVLGSLCLVGLVVAARQNSAEHFGVQCLYASSED